MTEFNITHPDVAKDLEAKMLNDEVVEKEPIIIHDKIITSEALSNKNRVRHHVDAKKKKRLANKLQSGDIPVIGLNRSQKFTNPAKVINKIAKKQRKLRHSAKLNRNKVNRRINATIKHDVIR